jgi:hypothetical protein
MRSLRQKFWALFAVIVDWHHVFSMQYWLREGSVGTLPATGSYELIHALGAGGICRADRRVDFSVDSYLLPTFQNFISVSEDGRVVYPQCLSSLL